MNQQAIKTTKALNDLLLDLGFTSKEVQVYLLILELGSRPAAALSKLLGIPKSTVLFICDALQKKGYLRKSQRGKTQFFSVVPEDLKTVKTASLKKEEQALSTVVPLLEELKSPYTSEPKLHLFSGVEGCRRAYRELLRSSTEILEYGVQQDLVDRLGKDFMNQFIRDRVKNKIPLRAIANLNDIDLQLQKRDSKELRVHRFFSPDFGKTYSSITVYEQKVLLLNLHMDTFGILIENKEVSDTLRTIFCVLWDKLDKEIPIISKQDQISRPRKSKSRIGKEN